jgi:hypothetical protein
MAQDNAALLQTAYDNLVLEFKNHTADRVLGKERVTYSLNGRNFQWSEYRKNILQELKDMAQVLAMNTVPYAEIRIQ